MTAGSDLFYDRRAGFFFNDLTFTLFTAGQPNVTNFATEGLDFCLFFNRILFTAGPPNVTNFTTEVLVFYLTYSLFAA